MRLLLLQILYWPFFAAAQHAVAAPAGAADSTAVLIASFVSQLKVNGVAAFVIQRLKDSKLPATAWINANTPWVTRAIALLVASATAAGLHWTYNAGMAGGTFIITGISLTAIVTALWHVAQNYLFQHAWYKMVFSSPASTGLQGRVGDAGKP
jgi:hypothetical protein